MTDLEKQMAEALRELHQEKIDYMRRNKLGDPFQEHATKQAAEVLAHFDAQAAEQAAGGGEAVANDWRLPADLRAGHVTFRAGVHCSALVSRMKMLHEAAFGVDSLTPEQKAENLAALRAGEPMPHEFTHPAPAAPVQPVGEKQG